MGDSIGWSICDDADVTSIFLQIQSFFLIKREKKKGLCAMLLLSWRPTLTMATIAPKSEKPVKFFASSTRFLYNIISLPDKKKRKGEVKQSNNQTNIWPYLFFSPLFSIHMLLLMFVSNETHPKDLTVSKFCNASLFTRVSAVPYIFLYRKQPYDKMLFQIPPKTIMSSPSSASSKKRENCSMTRPVDLNRSTANSKSLSIFLRGVYEEWTRKQSHEDTFCVTVG